MIRQFRIRDFKAHADTSLKLGRFTVLVGDNASGKTSVLQALRIQGALAADPASVLQGDWTPGDLMRRGGGGQLCLDADGETNAQPWTTSVAISEERSSTPSSWNVKLTGNRAGAHISATATVSQFKFPISGAWNIVQTLFGTVGVYNTSPEKVAAVSYSNDPGATIEADGTNTAVVLAALKLGDDEAFDRIENSMRHLIPSVTKIRIVPTAVRNALVEGSKVLGNKIHFDFVGAPNVPAHGASHGTLIVLSLLTVLYSRSRPNLILLDDFDHALHPRAQMELVKLLTSLLELPEFEDLQIVSTTHSPYVLDEVDPADVYAFALRPDGTAACKRLSEHPAAAKAAGTLASGQLWSLDPERDWVLRDDA